MKFDVKALFSRQSEKHPCITGHAIRVYGNNPLFLVSSITIEKLFNSAVIELMTSCCTLLCIYCAMTLQHVKLLFISHLVI